MAREKRSLGESLVEDGIITPAQLAQAQAEEKKTGHRLRKVLVRMGVIDEEDLVRFLSAKLSVPRIELGNYLIDSKLIELVPESLARKFELVPVLKIGNRITCVMIDPWNVFALDEVRMKTGLTVEPAVATEAEIRKAIDQYYGAKGTMEDLIRNIDEQKMGIEPQREVGVKKLQEITEEPVVIRLVNLIVMKAIAEGASDIHVEPEEESLKVRIRVDGFLHEIPPPPKHLQSAIISRIKIMSGMDIAERRIPQDGRFSVKTEGKEIDVRASVVPTTYGENVVLRLLNKESALLTLEQLGFSKEILERYTRLIMRPYGIILVTGPTGSGKTTTLYSSLDKVNTPEKNIITIEDPVEYMLPGIRQIHVNTKVDLTFASGLRSILRQDPNIIMVGEIRDPETAEIAIQAALTGHLVFSTLHTNDAATAVARLIDMGVEPFLASSSVIGILAQRLVRKICPHCRERYVPGAEALADVGMDPGEKADFYRGKGCDRCMQTGYKGRVSIYELLLPDDAIRKAIVSKASADEIKKLALAGGMVTLMRDGIAKVREGITTVEEVLRVTREA